MAKFSKTTVLKRGYLRRSQRPANDYYLYLGDDEYGLAVERDWFPVEVGDRQLGTWTITVAFEGEPESLEAKMLRDRDVEVRALRAEVERLARALPPDCVCCGDRPPVVVGRCEQCPTGCTCSVDL
jgi:hypothetical protein